MSKITRDDIQRIGDETTLLHFLEEKLNLPILGETTLAQIALPLPLPFLGLDDALAEQIIDCQDFSGLPKDNLGDRRPFFIRFRREQDYPEILRKVAEGLAQKNIDPSEIFFICADENFQPFAFAYFNDSTSRNWYTAVLTAFSWTRENTHINTGSEHELPASFFGEASADEFEDNLEDKTEINESNVIESPSDCAVSTKLETIGTRLGALENIYSGITTAYDLAFIIDAETRDRLCAKAPNSNELIKRSPRVNRKWTCDSKYLIYIPSSNIRQWRWSDARNESTAERIFEETYPAIYSYLNHHRDRLKKCNKSVQGKFYWERSSRRLDAMLKRPKIIYPLYPTSIQAVYDSLEGIPTSSFCIILTTDLSLLAILNSNCFQWYAKTNYQKQGSNQVSLKKGNMQNFPIAPQTETQKVELLNLVQQILDAPDSPNVPNLEEEINMLVYDLYDLTSAEIALIEKGHNP